MNQVLKLMQTVGYKVEDIKELITSLEMNKGFRELFELIRYNEKRFEVVIFSGCNTIFVDWIVERHQISDLIRKFYSNKAEISEDGSISVKRTHEHFCQMCDLSQCKQKLFKDYLEERLKENVTFENFVFIGDGKNDYCLTKGLKEGDLVCYRKGFPLEKLVLEGLREKEIICEGLCCESGLDVVEKLNKKN